MAPSPGIAASSATGINGSGVIFPPLTSGIDALLERFDAKPLYGVDEKLVGPGAQREIGLDNILDHIGDFAIGHRGADQRSNLGLLVGAAADRDLIDFFDVPPNTENTDVADV